MTFPLSSFQSQHLSGVEMLQNTDMFIFNSKTVKLFPIIFRMKPSCLILVSEAHRHHNGSQRF